MFTFCGRLKIMIKKSKLIRRAPATTRILQFCGKSNDHLRQILQIDLGLKHVLTRA